MIAASVSRTLPAMPAHSSWFSVLSRIPRLISAMVGGHEAYIASGRQGEDGGQIPSSASACGESCEKE